MRRLVFRLSISPTAPSELHRLQRSVGSSRWSLPIFLRCILEIQDRCLGGTCTFKKKRTNLKKQQAATERLYLPRCTTPHTFGSLPRLLCIREAFESACRPEGRLFGGRSFVDILSPTRKIQHLNSVSQI